MIPHPGEVWLADLGWAAKTRPVVIVLRHDPDPPWALVVYVPLTTQDRHSSYEVPIPKLAFLNAISVANVRGIASIPAQGHLKPIQAVRLSFRGVRKAGERASILRITSRS
jgi:mRNA interferase MazF